MHKTIALYINEMIKTAKKTSILVIFILMVVGVFALGGLIRLQDSMFQDQGMHRSQDEWMIEEMEYVRNSQNEELQRLRQERERLTEPDDATEIQMLEEQIASTEDQIGIYDLALAENIVLITGNSYLNQTLYGITDLKRELRQHEMTTPAERDDAWQEEKERLNRLIDRHHEIVDDRDFEAFLAMKREGIENEEAWPDDQKAYALERLELWQQLDPSGGVEDLDWGNQVQQVLYQVENLRRSLTEGIDYTDHSGRVPLTPQRYEELEDQLAVLLYRIDENLIEANLGFSLSANAMQTMTGFGLFLLVMMMLILAGGTISQEIATGSIKSLIIAPARRWKIFAAKLGSLFSVSLLGLIVLYIVALLAYVVFFGLSDASPYVFARNGQAASLSFPVYQLGRLAISLLDVWVFMFLALALSSLTRNTAASVGIGMAAYFGANMAQNFLLLMPDAEWVKFLPFANTGLADRVFSFQDSMATINGMFGFGGGRQPSVLFSLVYLFALSFCLIYAAHDSFNRRDIK